MMGRRPIDDYTTQKWIDDFASSAVRGGIHALAVHDNALYIRGSADEDPEINRMAVRLLFRLQEACAQADPKFTFWVLSNRVGVFKQALDNVGLELPPFCGTVDGVEHSAVKESLHELFPDRVAVITARPLNPAASTEVRYTADDGSLLIFFLEGLVVTRSVPLLSRPAEKTRRDAKKIPEALWKQLQERLSLTEGQLPRQDELATALQGLVLAPRQSLDCKKTRRRPQRRR